MSISKQNQKTVSLKTKGFISIWQMSNINFILFWDSIKRQQQKILLKYTEFRGFDFFFSFSFFLPSFPQALEDHTIRHAKILEALEAEKQKIAEEIHTLQKNRGSGNKTMTSTCIYNVARATLTSLCLVGLDLVDMDPEAFSLPLMLL